MKGKKSGRRPVARCRICRRRIGVRDETWHEAATGLPESAVFCDRCGCFADGIRHFLVDTEHSAVSDLQALCDALAALPGICPDDAEYGFDS
jgi:hypothetical protein